MANKQEFTLSDLAKIALSGPDMTTEQIGVLHSLIVILLKKLGCRDEKLIITGYESQQLREKLSKAKIPRYAFQEDQLTFISQKMERVKCLEERVNAVSKQLEDHFENIRTCNRLNTDPRFEYKYWEKYSGPCEDLCIVCDRENEIACDLVKNADFLKKLMRRISDPLVERMFEFERKVSSLRDEFLDFMKRTDEQFMKIALVERCIEEIEILRKQIDDNHLQFLSAMEEVQDMFDTKLDKIHLPALKKYVRDRFNSIEDLINSLQKPPSCPENLGVVMDGIKCLCCGSERVCAEKGVNVTPLMPSLPVKKPIKPNKKYCCCKLLKDQTELKDLQGVKVTRTIVEMSENNAKVKTFVSFKKQGPGPSCQHQVPEGILKQCNNGMWYRMDPDVLSVQTTGEESIKTAEEPESRLGGEEYTVGDSERLISNPASSDFRAERHTIDDNETFIVSELLNE